MKKILYINHGFTKKCGVYDLGYRHFNSLNLSKKYIFKYVEICSHDEYIKKINEESPDAIFLNWMPNLFDFLNNKTKLKDKKIYCIPHLIAKFNEKEYKNFYQNYKNMFDYIIMLDPSSTDIDGFFKTDRPLINFESKHREKNSIPNIGSFGFAFDHKKFDLIVKKTNEEFDEAVLNFYISEAFFNDNHERLNSIIDSCFKQIKKTNIKLNINTNFLSYEELLINLNKNDINCLFYQDNLSVGVSSALDYLLSAQKPIMLSNSQMFRSYSNMIPKFNESLKDIYDNYEKNLNNIENIYLNSINNILLDTEKILDKTIS